MKNLKIFYDGWQYECCGDPFKIGDAVKWGAAKFAPVNGFVFKDADYSYEAHGEETCEISGIVVAISAIYYRYEAGEKLASGFELVQIASSAEFDENFMQGSFLVELKDAVCIDFLTRLFEKYEQSGEFSGVQISSSNEISPRGETLLNLAVKSGEFADVQTLIKSGADVNLAGAGGATSLWHACKNRDENTVRILLSSGADPDAKDDNGVSVRDLAQGKILKILKKFKR